MNNHKSVKILAISILHSNVSPCSKYLRVSPFYRTCSCFLLRLSSGRGSAKQNPVDLPSEYPPINTGVQNPLFEIFYAAMLVKTGDIPPPAGICWGLEPSTERSRNKTPGYPILEASDCSPSSLKKFQQEESTFRRSSYILTPLPPFPLFLTLGRRWGMTNQPQRSHGEVSPKSRALFPRLQGPCIWRSRGLFLFLGQGCEKEMGYPVMAYGRSSD